MTDCYNCGSEVAVIGGLCGECRAILDAGGGWCDDCGGIHEQPITVYDFDLTDDEDEDAP